MAEDTDTFKKLYARERDLRAVERAGFASDVMLWRVIAGVGWAGVVTLGVALVTKHKPKSG